MRRLMPKPRQILQRMFSYLIKFLSSLVYDERVKVFELFYRSESDSFWPVHTV